LASLLNPALVRVARNYSETAARIALIPPLKRVARLEPLEVAFQLARAIAPVAVDNSAHRHAWRAKTS
jgi:hypothetical protein